MDLKQAFLPSLLLLPFLGLSGCSSDDNSGGNNTVNPPVEVPPDPVASDEAADRGEDNLVALTADSFEQALADFEEAVKFDKANDRAKFLLAVTSFVDFLNDIRTSQSGGGASPLGRILEKDDFAVSGSFPGQSSFSGPLPPTIVKAFELLESDVFVQSGFDNGTLSAGDLFSAPTLLPSDSATGADYQAWVRGLRDTTRRAAELLESIDPAFRATLELPVETIVDPLLGPPTVDLVFSDALVLAMQFRALEISAGFGIAFDLDMDIDELANWEENGLPAPYRLFNGSSPQVIDQGKTVTQDLGNGGVTRRGFLNESALTRSANTFLPAADADATFLAIRLAMLAFVEDFQALISLEVSELQDEFVNGPADEFNPFVDSVDLAAEKVCLDSAFGPWLADVRQALLGVDPFIAAHFFQDFTCGLDVAFTPFTFRAAGLLSAATYSGRVFLPELDNGQLFADASDFSTAVNSPDLRALALETAGLSIDGATMLALWESLEGAWESEFLGAGQIPGPGPDPDPDPSCGSTPPLDFQLCFSSPGFPIEWTTDGSPNGTSFSVSELSLSSQAGASVFSDSFDSYSLQVFGATGIGSDSDEVFFFLDSVASPGTFFVQLGGAGYIVANSSGQVVDEFRNDDSSSTFMQVIVETLTDQCISGSFTGKLQSTFDDDLMDISGTFDFRTCSTGG